MVVFANMLIGVPYFKTNREYCMGICLWYGHSPKEPSVLRVNNDYIIYISKRCLNLNN